MKIAFQMESPADSDRELSASLLLMQEACARGYEVFHFLPENLSLDHKAGVIAYAAPAHIDLSKDQYYTLGDLLRLICWGLILFFFVRTRLLTWAL